MEAHYCLFVATRDRSHIYIAKRILDHLVEHASDEFRESMLKYVRLHGWIMEAWRPWTPACRRRAWRASRGAPPVGCTRSALAPSSAIRYAGHASNEVETMTCSRAALFITLMAALTSCGDEGVDPAAGGTPLPDVASQPPETVPQILLGAPPPDAAGETRESLGPGEQLELGQLLRSGTGNYRLILQKSDGNLVLYDDTNRAVWAPRNEIGRSLGGAASAVMQEDGNFVLYTPSREALWATDTDGNGGARLYLRSDGTLEVQAPGGRTVWSSSGKR